MKDKFLRGGNSQNMLEIITSGADHSRNTARRNGMIRPPGCYYIGGLALASIISPSFYWDILRDDAFESLRGNAEFEELCDRVQSLIEIRPKEETSG